MRIRRRHVRDWQAGALLAEAGVALAILAGIMLPLAFAFRQETQLCRAGYVKAIAMEIVDGEIEILAAGEWRAFSPGTHSYPVRTLAATNLPPGEFMLTLDAQRARLEWKPRKSSWGGAIAREVALR